MTDKKFCIAFTGVLLSSFLLCSCSQGSQLQSSVSPAGSTSVSQADNSSESEFSCKELAELVLNSIEFPDMQEVTDSAMLENIMDFSAYGITDYYVYQQMMSVHLNEIIILKSSDPESALIALEERRDMLINQLSFYPEQQESAKATVTGRKDNICYLIAHKEADEAEKSLLLAI